MSIEGGGSSALSVALAGVAIGGLLLGAGALPSLGGHAPGADAIDADRLPNVQSDADSPQQPAGGSGSMGSGGGGSGSASGLPGASGGGGGSMPEALLSLGKLLGPLGDIELGGSGGAAVDGGGGSIGDAADGEDGSASGGENGDGASGGENGDGASDGENGDGSTGDSGSDAETGEGSAGDGGDSASDASSGGDTASGGGADAGTGESADGEGSGDGGIPSFLPYLLGGLAVVGVLAYLYRTDRDVVTAVRLLPRRIVGVAVGALLALSNLLERAIGELRRVESLAALPGRVLDALVKWFASLRRRTEAVTLGAFGGKPTAAGGASAAEAGDVDPSSARERIYDAWESVLDAAPVRSYRTAAPGEVAREAAASGLPSGPVRTIADAFRDVEYGERDPETRVDRAESARDDLTAAIEADGDEGSDASADDRGTTADDANDGGGDAAR